MNFNFFSLLCKFYNAVLPATFGNVNVVYVALEHTYTGIKMRTYKLKSLSSCLQTPDGRKLCCCCRASVNSNNPEKPGFSRPTTYLGVTSPPVCLFFVCVYIYYYNLLYYIFIIYNLKPIESILSTKSFLIVCHFDEKIEQKQCP